MIEAILAAEANEVVLQTGTTEIVLALGPQGLTGPGLPTGWSITFSDGYAELTNGVETKHFRLLDGAAPV